MPLALLVIGILAVVVAIKGNYAAVWTQLDNDFTGAGNFIYWIAAIVVLALASLSVVVLYAQVGIVLGEGKLEKMQTVNVFVGECNDGILNNIHQNSYIHDMS